MDVVIELTPLHIRTKALKCGIILGPGLVKLSYLP